MPGVAVNPSKSPSRPAQLACRVARAAAVAGCLLLGSLLPASAQEGWATGEVPTGENFRSLWLAYTENGVQRFGANCRSNDNVVHFQLPFVLADTGEGASISLELQAGGASAQLSGFVSTYQVNAGNANGALPTASPIVTSLASAPQLSFGVPGQQSSVVPLSSGRQQVSTFIGTCVFLQSGGSQQAAAPAPQPQTLTLGLEAAPQTTVAGPTDAPILGLWQQTSSSYMPCPNCRALVFRVGGTREAGHIGGFYTDSCLYGELRLNGELTRNVYGEGAARIRMSPTGNATATGNASLQVNGSQLTITITPTGAAGDGLVGTIVESYQKVAGPQGVTSDLFNSFQAADGGVACARYPQGAELAVFGQGGGTAASPDQVAQGTTQSEGFTAGDAALIGALAVGGAIIANEIADQFFTEAPAPDAPDGQGARTTVTINSVTANSTTLGFGGDEIFLLFSDGTRFPASGDSYQEIEEGQVWRPNASGTTSGGISVDLREWDSFNASDIIGNLAIEANRAPGQYTATLRGDGGDYLVEYSVARGGGQVPTARITPVQPQPADQPASNRVWAAHGGNESITVTDCRDDCEEDIGILLQCQGLGQPALVDVPWVASETGPAGAVKPLSIIVGSQSYVFSATLGNYGMVGHVPSFTIPPNDPVIEALQAGSAATVVFEGKSTTLGLKGSRSALDVFKAHCGWNRVVQAPTVQQPVQQDTQPYWFTSQYTDFSTGQARTSLTFGIPETDATGFFAACTPGGNNTVIPVDLIVDFANQPAGASVPVYIQTSSYTAQYQGRVFISSSEWAGVRIGVSPSDPIWQAMQREPQLISYGVGGAQQGLSTLTGVAQAVPQFLASCFRGPGSTGQQPVQQTPVQQPIQPQVVQPVQPQVVQPVQQPIQQQVTQPVQQQQVTQPVQQQQVTQPVQQQGGLASGMDFTCDDGSRLIVNLVAAGAVSVANVTRNGTLVTLVEVPTAVGKKYSNGEATLNVSGMTAQFVAQGASLFCQAN